MLGVRRIFEVLSTVLPGLREEICEGGIRSTRLACESLWETLEYRERLFDCLRYLSVPDFIFERGPDLRNIWDQASVDWFVTCDTCFYRPQYVKLCMLVLT